MANKRLKIAAILMLIHGALMEAVPGLLLMPFVAMIPAGIADGILASTALLLLLSGYFRNQKITE